MDDHKYLASLKTHLNQKESELQSLTSEIANIKRQIDQVTEAITIVGDQDPNRVRHILWEDLRILLSTNKGLWGYKGKSTSKRDKHWCMVTKCQQNLPILKHELATFSHGNWRVCGSCLDKRSNDCMTMFNDENIANDEVVSFDPEVYSDTKIMKLLSSYLL